MKNYIFIICILSALNSFAQVDGQWLSDKALMDCSKGDTIHLTKTKFKDSFFQWGQPPFGIHFDKGGSFSEYYTVMCSTESSPLVYSDEKWSLKNKTEVTVTSEKRTINLKIISRKGKKVAMVII